MVRHKEVSKAPEYVLQNVFYILIRENTKRMNAYKN